MRDERGHVAVLVRRGVDRRAHRARLGLPGRTGASARRAEVVEPAAVRDLAGYRRAAGTDRDAPRGDRDGEAGMSTDESEYVAAHVQEALARDPRVNERSE